MKDGIQQTIGKTITGIVVGYNARRDPTNQVFLVFDDGTYFEFWGAQFSCASGVDRGGVAEAVDYLERCCASKVADIYPRTKG